jgi:hypothetical protein
MNANRLLLSFERTHAVLSCFALLPQAVAGYPLLELLSIDDRKKQNKRIRLIGIDETTGIYRPKHGYALTSIRDRKRLCRHDHKSAGDFVLAICQRQGLTCSIGFVRIGFWQSKMMNTLNQLLTGNAPDIASVWL